MKIITCEQRAEIYRKAAEKGLTTVVLMDNAGRMVADEIAKAAGDIKDKKILVLVGRDINGGDGLSAASYLRERDAQPTVYQFGYRDPLEDPAYSGVQQKNIRCVSAEDDSKFSNLEEVLASTDIVIDALLGPGDTEPMGDLRKGALQRVSNAKSIRPQMLVLSLDIPSGLNSDTGAVDASTLNCDLTITLGYPKVGLFLFPGASRVGKLIVADIGVPHEIATDINIELITEDWARSSLPPRPLNANKASFGRVLIIAGSINYVGAAYLSCMGAYRVGAGLVTLATPTSLVGPLLSKMTEVVFVPLTQSAAGIAAEDAFKDVKRDTIASNVMLIGPGLGRSKAPQEFIKDTLGNLQPASSPNLVIDGDALDAVKEVDKWWKKLPKQIVLTPNSGELSRMLTEPITDIEKDRLSFAKKAAKEWDNTIVLKGAYTIIASFDGRTRICPSANPSLASSGTGDVLGGMIAGLLAQGMGFFDASSLGVYLHAMAGELLREQFGDSGIIAGDLPLAIPHVMKKYRAELMSRAEPVTSAASTSLWRSGGALS